MWPDRWDYPRYIWQVLSGFRVRHERSLAGYRRRDLSQLIDLDRSPRVLDLANGRLRPQYMLMRREGQRAVGVDLINRPVSNWVDVSYRLARWWYRRQLSINLRDDTLTCGNVNVLPFADNIFDVVSSIAAFEHFLNVPQVVGEIDRVLRPGGVAWILIHPFPCLSGGHNVSLSQIPLRHLPKGVAAWDHLRQRRLPFHVPLNEWRPDQYRQAFVERFEIVQAYCVTREGEEFLTPTVLTELASYKRDELTCSAYVIVARKNK